METTPPALPVPPLTEEQKAELKQLAEAASPGSWHIDERLPKVVLSQWGLPIAHIESGREVFKGGLAFRAKNAEYIAAASPATTLSLLAENAHLSRLLEEERRTVARMKQEHQVEVNQLRMEAAQWEQSALALFDAAPTPSQPEARGKQAAAPTCQRDCQKCAGGVGLQGEEGRAEQSRLEADDFEHGGAYGR